MINLKATWTMLKSKELPMRYAEANGNYYIYCNTETAEYCCVVETGSSAGTEFRETYKGQATSLV